MGIDRRRRQGGYLPLRDAIDQLFEGSFITPQVFSGQAGNTPVDLYVTEEDVVVDMAVPGANPDDINISVTGDTVTVGGEIKRPEHKGQPYLEEIFEGRFQRSFSLPIQVDANGAEASFHNGILTLRLPKSEATRPRRIQVRQQQPTIQGQSGQSSQGSTQSETVPVRGQ